MMPKPPASPPLDGLLDLACRDGVDVRPTLLRVLTDLYVQKPSHTSYEETQYVELALGLIRNVDAATRAAVTANLKAYHAAPVAVLDALADATRLTGESAATSVTAAPAPPTASHTPTNELVDLFFEASPDERRLILTNLDAVEPVRFRLPAAVHQTVADLESAALKRDMDAFERVLERDLGMQRDLADRIAHDDLGESIVVVAKAIGMKAPVLQRILLFLNPRIGQSIERVYNLSNLFDELSAQAANHLLATWRQPAARKTPTHAPVLYDDERRRARPAAAPARSGERALPAGQVKTDRA